MRTLDIFSGAGGSSAGARRAGATTVAAIDMCSVATATFEQNFPSAKVYTKRLEEINLASLRRSIGNIDLLLSSPECTNHTCAKGSAPRDEKSRATAMHVVKYAEAFKPRWIVLENVVHMRPWTRYGELKNELVALGYNLAEQVLDASNFGVAQTRRRLFLVGDRRQVPKTVNVQAKKRKLSARSILDPRGLWPTSPLLRENRAKDTLARASRAIDELGENKSFILVYYGSDGSGGWQSISRPLRTVTTVDRFALVEPTSQGYQMRMLQVPELRRAMGFDDKFSLLHGTRRDKVRLLGNGVCPPVMEAVVAALTES
ncbi:DNA cytosine methyltransferase [Bradyrhizobium sp. HKCCYLRH1065]|uniref:DNA cytosine methyltransferase n=1 Tax=unclassified Bradyrhizobium TaxID=2631580 RepID=UPI003EB82790